MKRGLVKLVVFLLLGAIVNVAVAWGVSVFAPIRVMVIHQGIVSRSPTDPPMWQNSVHSQFGALLVDAAAWRYPRTQLVVLEQGVPVIKDGGPMRVVLAHPLPGWSATQLPPSEADFLRGRTIREIAYGWPMVTLYSREDSGKLKSGIAPYGALPIQPIWPAVIVNSLVYAVMLAFGVVAWRSVGLRRRIRIRRGLCPACAYPIGASDVCTECGKTVIKQKAEKQKAEMR